MMFLYMDVPVTCIHNCKSHVIDSFKFPICSINWHGKYPSLHVFSLNLQDRDGSKINLYVRANKRVSTEGQPKRDDQKKNQDREISFQLAMHLIGYGNATVESSQNQNQTEWGRA